MSSRFQRAVARSSDGTAHARRAAPCRLAPASPIRAGRCADWHRGLSREPSSTRIRRPRARRAMPHGLLRTAPPAGPHPFGAASPMQSRRPSPECGDASKAPAQDGRFGHAVSPDRTRSDRLPRKPRLAARSAIHLPATPPQTRASAKENLAPQKRHDRLSPTERSDDMIATMTVPDGCGCFDLRRCRTAVSLPHAIKRATERLEPGSGLQRSRTPNASAPCCLRRLVRAFERLVGLSRIGSAGSRYPPRR